MTRFDITGEKFGKLLVLSFSHMKDSRQYWNYRCDCGNEKIMQHKPIKSGLTKSCGCLNHLPKYDDLIGHKFNKLTVLSFSHIEKDRTYWNCECECGNNKVLQGKEVKTGGTKSCGCLRNRPQYDDLTGKRFNMLEVIAYSRTVGKVVYFQVKCECGTIKSTRATDLKTGKTQSCGCRGRGSQTIGTIYGIYDDCDKLMYIGQTVKHQIDDRLKSHLTQPTNVNMQQWFESINYLPTIKPIMKNVPIDILNYAEKKAIFFYKNKFTLLNMTHN